MKTVLIIGATGNIGRAAAATLLESGYRVIGTSRGGEQADALRATFPTDAFILVQGSVSEEAAAAALRSDVLALGRPIDAVIANLNTTPKAPETLLAWDAAALQQTIHSNLITHFVAAKTFLPDVSPGGAYIGIGGGMADRLMSGYGYNSMYQVALRMMFRYIDLEAETSNVAIREVVIGAMVSNERNAGLRSPAFPWISEKDVGAHLRHIIERPEAFPGTIHLLDSSVAPGVSCPIELPPLPVPSALI